MNLSRQTALLWSDRYLDHETGNHPEHRGRLQAIGRALRQADQLAGRPEIPFVPASTAAITRVHDARYVDALERFARDGGGMIDGDTIVSPASWDVATLGAGAAIALVDAALDGGANRGFSLSRPPGHHATPSRGMGFCLLNNVAIAAAHALARDVPRVAIVDWDVHHGNGTQDTFYEDDRVFFCSIHQWPLYPMSGRAEERGRGDGYGTTLNLPQPPGRTDDDYLALFDRRVAPAVRGFDPDLILLSAGFDAHGADPLGGMDLTAAGFGELARRLALVADDHCDGRLVAVLEGGYDPPATAASVVATLAALDGESAPVGLDLPRK
ncbi:MAG TPA: histone deacetylase [Thermomicrobiales bacterium]|jgi:acetoin utilization deacetylase AcuC-like enzyme|nr:histone deacetylase [Thermomicrobiales bacterium]